MWPRCGGEEAMEGSLDDITRRFERSVLTQLYRSFPSTRKLAKRLGVSHTAIANKLREYGLSQKKARVARLSPAAQAAGDHLMSRRLLTFRPLLILSFLHLLGIRMSTSPGHLLQWMKLLGLSAGLSGLLFWLHPCGIAAGADDRRDKIESARGANIRVPRPFYCRSGHYRLHDCPHADPSVFSVLIGHWPLVLLILFSTLAVSALAGGCWAL
jgi:TyrR family helix-turn-helix protein